jgi:phosphoribosylglycinamide formyltransferase-1
MISRPLRLGFLASANGSSARAIVAAIQAGELAAEARLMVSNRRDAPALEFARAAGIPALHIPTKPDPEASDERLTAELVAHGVDLVILSGYLRRLGPRVLSRFAGRVLNIHPGPLPQFGGEGMYGRRVHEAVLTSGVRESGVVIHVVDGNYDEGPVLARRSVEVLPGDTVEDLQSRVTSQEPQFFVETLKAIAERHLEMPA